MIQQPLWRDHSFTKKDVCHALFYFYCQSHSRQRSAFRKLVCQNPQLFFYSKYRFRDLTVLSARRTLSNLSGLIQLEKTTSQSVLSLAAVMGPSTKS